MISDLQLRKAVKFVAVANLLYFFVEFSMALKIGSVSLFADSIDFLEDSSVNFLILLALGWSIKKRARVGFVLAALLMVPAIATLFAAWEKFNSMAPPEPVTLSIVGAGALLVNVVCAFRLVKYKNYSGSLTMAAFYSARNDAFANIAIILAALATAFTGTGWPDLIIGIAIALLNAGAAKEVYEAARQERLDSKA